MMWMRLAGILGLYGLPSAKVKNEKKKKKAQNKLYEVTIREGFDMEGC